MNLEHLKLTQDGLRLTLEEIQSMVNFIRDGGRFSEDALESHDPERTSLIAITKFPDGNLFIRDGLHRSIAIYLGRDDHILYENEFIIESMTYEMYTTPAIDKEWYTPFDPRIEVRKSDFHDFKEQVLKIKEEQGDVEKFIKDNKQMYCLLRNYKHQLKEIADQLSLNKSAV